MQHFLPVRKVTMQEFLLVPEALLQLLLARIKVSFFHSRAYLPQHLNTTQPPLSKEKIAKSKLVANVINGLSTRTPFPSTCLVKALAAHYMLSKRFIPHTLHVGIKREFPTGLAAHAWLSVAAEIIIGGNNVDDFKEISGL